LAFLAEQDRSGMSLEEMIETDNYDRIMTLSDRVGSQYARSFGVIHLSFVVTIFVFICYCLGVKALTTGQSILLTVGFISLASVAAFYSQFIIGEPKYIAIGGAASFWFVSCIVYGILYGIIESIRRSKKRKWKN
jgi:hypothetical protein